MNGLDYTLNDHNGIRQGVYKSKQADTKSILKELLGNEKKNARLFITIAQYFRII